MPTWGLTPDGFVAKTLEEIEASMVQQQRDHIDPAIDTSQFGLIGQLNGIMASEIASVWELAEAVNDAQDPAKATGAQQDALYSITGPPREDARVSVVVADCTLEPGTSIAVGEAIASVAGNPDSRFANAELLVNATGAVVVVSARFEALEPGPLVANANTLTVRDTLPVGWTAVNNPLDADPGADIESDAAYRHRREDELAGQGGGTLDGIRADLLKLETVMAVGMIENVDSVEVNGVPPKSFVAIVRSTPLANDEQTIAETIWAVKPAGIQAFGDVERTVVDVEGNPHVIGFARATDKDVYIALRLTTGPEYIGHDALKAAIVASAETPGTAGYLDVGVDVYAGQYVTVAMQQKGVLNAECRVSFAIADYDSGVPSLVIAANETGAVDTSRISIVPIPTPTPGSA